MIFTPDSVISDNFPDIARDLYTATGTDGGMGVPSDATLLYLSLIPIYTLQTGLRLREHQKVDYNSPLHVCFHDSGYRYLCWPCCR